MELEETLQIIESYLGDISNNFIFKSYKIQLEKCFFCIKEQINIFSADGIVSNQELLITKSIILNSFISILNAITYRPIKQKDNIFVKSYCELIYNWNNNTIKDDDIKTMTDLTIILLDNHFFMIKYMKELKIIISIMNRFRSWFPISIQSAKTFFGALNDKRCV